MEYNKCVENRFSYVIIRIRIIIIIIAITIRTHAYNHKNDRKSSIHSSGINFLTIMCCMDESPRENFSIPN
jgi:hypothetical protein